MSGIDLEQVYQDGGLRLAELAIQDPVFLLSGKSRSDRGEDSRRNAVRWLLDGLSPDLAIDRIHIRQAYADLGYDPVRGNDLVFDLDSIVVEDFKLDPDIPLFDRGNYPFQRIQIRIRDVVQQWAGGNTEVKAGSVFLDSDLRTVSVENIRLQTRGEDQWLAKLPRLDVQGVEIWELLLDQKVNVEGVMLWSPDLEVVLSGDNPLSSSEDVVVPDEKFIRALAASLPFDTIISQELRIRDGRIAIDSLLEIGAFDLRLRGFRFLAGETSDQNLWEEMDIAAGALSWRDSDMQFLGDSLYTDGRDLSIRGLSWWDGLGRHRHLYLPSTRVKGLDFVQLLRQEILADSIFLIDPELDLDSTLFARSSSSDRPRMATWVGVENGRLHYTAADEDEWLLQSISLSGHLDSLWQLESFNLGALGYQSPRKNLGLESGPWRALGSVRSFILDSVRLFRLEKEARSPEYRLDLRRIRLYGLDWETWRAEQTLALERMVLESPDLFTQWPDSLQTTEAGSGLLRLPRFRIDTLLLVDGTWKGSYGRRISAFSLPDLTLALYNIRQENDYLSKKNIPDLVDGLLLEAGQGLKLAFPGWTVSTSGFSFNRNLDLAGLSGLQIQSDSSQGLLIDLGQITLQGLPDPAMLIRDSLRVSQVDIQGGRLNYHRDRSTESVGEGRYFRALDWLHIDRFRMDDLALELDIGRPIELAGVNLDLEGINLDTTSVWQQPWAWTRRQQITARSVSYLIGAHDEYAIRHDLNWEGAESGTLEIDSLTLSKRLSNVEFVALQPYRKEYWSAQAASIRLRSPGGLAGVFSDTLHFTCLEINSLQARAYNDETQPLRPTYNPMLPQRVKEAPWPFLLDTIRLKKGYVRYAALAPLTKTQGYIDFYNLNAGAYHLSNLPDQWDQAMEFRAMGDIYGKASFWVKMAFDLRDSLDGFKIEGQVGPFDLPLINPILKSQAAIEVTRGRARRMLFNAAANDTLAVGEMIFRYRGLGIQILDKQNLEKRSLGKSIVSFWANRLVSSNNPSWLRRRKGVIYFERDRQKAVTHYWLHTVLSGVVSSVGMQNNKKRLRRSGLDADEELGYQRLLKEQLKLDPDRTDRDQD